MQTKDIPEAPIIEFLLKQNRPTGWHALGGTLGGTSLMPSVRDAFPHGTPDNMILSKMRSLIKRGIVNGCACGCRGDFTIARAA